MSDYYEQVQYEMMCEHDLQIEELAFMLQTNRDAEPPVLNYLFEVSFW